jgi:hypothetical protein
MSTWVGIEVNGFEVESYQNHHSTWFFRNNDRVRFSPPHDESEHNLGVFIGYRASVATIRRRMALAGYDMRACELHFSEYLDIVISSTQETISLLEDSSGKTDHMDDANDRLSKQIVVYKNYIDAIKGSMLEDWIALFPQALNLEREANRFYDSFNEAQWFEDSDNALLCAMLSNVPFFSEYSITGLFNFPSDDSNHFITAFLASCQEDSVCELNIAQLISAGYEEDFGDLEEIQQGTTVPFRSFRQSLNDFQQLSTLKSDDQVLQRMCYSGIITAMEAYLSDIMKREVLSNENVKRRFVEKSGTFEAQKLKVEDIYDFLDRLDKRITKELDTTSFHNIQTAHKMFQDVLLIEFPCALVPDLKSAVIKRHDIVHRNGKSANGQMLNVTSEDVSELLSLVAQCVENIDQQVLDALAKDNEEGEEG